MGSGLLRVAFGLLQTTRLPTGLLIGGAVLVPLRLSGGDTALAALSAAPFSLAAMGGFALNDYCDADRDRINNRHRAIPRGALSPGQVLAVGILLLGAALLATGLHGVSRAHLFLSLAAVGGVVVYNLVVARMAPLKTLYTAVLYSLPVWYVAGALRSDAACWLFPLATLLFGVGRELLMDIRDVAGDRRSGITTVPMILGRVPTVVLSFVLQILGAALLAPVALAAAAPWAAALWAGVLVAIALALAAWGGVGERAYRPVIYFLWVPMLLGLAVLFA